MATEARKQNTAPFVGRRGNTIVKTARGPVRARSFHSGGTAVDGERELTDQPDDHKYVAEPCTHLSLNVDLWQPGAVPWRRRTGLR